jgi:peptidoglycan/xylan/chitin deacetylase (PgdA/CDA1 family)
MISKNKNIFIFPQIEKMYLDTIPKTHIPKDEIVIGYHGNQNHLNHCDIGLKNALERLNKVFKIKFVYTCSNSTEWIQGKPNIVLTFDDGYRNNFLFAKPILEEAKVNGTFYITGLNEGESDILWADFLNIAVTLTLQDINIEGENFRQNNGKYLSLDSGKSLYSIIKDENASTEYKFKMMDSFKSLYDFKTDISYDDYWKLMTDKEIYSCSKSKYIEIGSHGFLHNNLGTITQDKAYKEISDSKKYLENVIQKKIVSIGYPDGSYTRDTIDSAESLGFLYQTAVSYKFSDDIEDDRIHDRSGVYTCDSCANQIMLLL